MRKWKIERIEAFLRGSSSLRKTGEEQIKVRAGVEAKLEAIVELEKQE